MTLLAILAVWTLASIPCGILIARCIPRDPRNQSTRESEAPFAIGGGADLIPTIHDNGSATK